MNDAELYILNKVKGALFKHVERGKEKKNSFIQKLKDESCAFRISWGTDEMIELEKKWHVAAGWLKWIDAKKDVAEIVETFEKIIENETLNVIEFHSWIVRSTNPVHNAVETSSLKGLLELITEAKGWVRDIGKLLEGKEI